MLTFFLIRHGHKEFVPYDPSLTEAGIQQAKITAVFLKSISVTEIICSPKTRTRQTAEFIAEIQSIPVKFDERIAERLEWEKNETFEEFVNEWSKTDLDRTYKPQDRIANSSLEKGTIMRSVIDESIRKYKEGNTLFITHGGAIGDLLRNLFGEEAIVHDIDPTTKAPHIHISECSITKIIFAEGKYKLADVNNTSHLPANLISKD